MSECPFHSGDSDESSNESTNNGGEQKSSIGRRDFVQSALLIGGASAVGTLGSVAGITTNVRAEDDTEEVEPISPSARLNRQHAWNTYESITGTGHTVPPANSMFLFLDYLEDGEPTPAHQREVGEALTEIERHFDWKSDGVMFTMAYSASYFDRFDETLPPGAAPDRPQEVAKTVTDITELADTNNDITPDTYDAVLLLASENEANLLAVESALWGNDDSLDISFSATFEEIFTKPTGWPERRVGFAGPEFQEKETEYEDRFLEEDQSIPDKAPLSMGFVAGFGGSIPEEEIVTLKQGQEFPSSTTDPSNVPDLDYVGDTGTRDPGMFAQGTLKHVSHLKLDLDAWYAEGEDQRRHQMYSPFHTQDETRAKSGEKPGSGLAADEMGPADGPDQNSKTVREYAAEVEATATGDETAETDAPTVGHSQKTARSRYDIDGDGEPEQPVLRRDWDNIAPVAPDGADAAGYHFNVPMRFNESIYTLLDSTYNIEFTSLDGRIDHQSVDNDAIQDRNGIAPFMSATRRGNWLVPPITLRALPPARAEDASISVEVDDETTHVVKITGTEQKTPKFDSETVRYGYPKHVNKAGGATPTDVTRRDGTLRFTFDFPNTEAAPTDGDMVKLFGKQKESIKPVSGVTTLDTEPTATASANDEQKETDLIDNTVELGIATGVAGLSAAGYMLHTHQNSTE